MLSSASFAASISERAGRHCSSFPNGPIQIGHARFGWRLLEQIGLDLTLEEQRAVERYLPVAFEHLAVHEISHLPELFPPPGGEMLGLCSGGDARRLFGETVREVIRPGLARWFVC